MTVLRPVLEGYIDLNIALVFSLLIWFGARAALSRTRYAVAYPMQLSLLMALFVCVLLSPLLGGAVSHAYHLAAPKSSLAVSDIAVAAFLQGSIDMKAVEFEALLNTRQRWLDALVGGNTPLSLGLAGLLAAGASALLARVIRTGLSIRRTIGASFLWRRTARVDIRLSDRVRVPFAARGLRRRYVVLPSAMVTQPRAMRFVLAHEFQHIRQGDVEWEIAFECFRPLVFWNPAIGVWKAEIDRLRELSCDQIVIASRRVDVRDYTTCLLDICARTVGASSPKVMNVAFVQTGRARRVLKRRILALRQGKPQVATGSHAAVAILALTLGVAIAIGSASIRQSKDWSQDRLMLSTVVNLERLEAINGRGF
ncbi:MAG: M56 family metallopeptidase [Pseudomonadota bacterium]